MDVYFFILFLIDGFHWYHTIRWWLSTMVQKKT